MPPQIKAATGAVKRTVEKAVPVLVTAAVDAAQATANNPGGSPGLVSIATMIIRRQAGL